MRQPWSSDRWRCRRLSLWSASRSIKRLSSSDAEEVARDVEHHPAPGEPRPVVDGDDGDLPRARSSPRRLDRIGQELPQRLDAADEPGRRARGERHECRRDRQPVSLLPEGAVTGAEGDDDVAAGGRAGRAHRQPEARGRSEVEGEETGGRRGVGAGIEGREHDPRRTLCAARTSRSRARRRAASG